MQCIRCEFLCALTQEWSGKCGMYRAFKDENGKEKLENRFYVERKISEMTRQPIEAVPIFHFKPGTTVLNIGTVSCNFECKYCINERLSMIKPNEVDKIHFFSESPSELLARANAFSASAIVFGQNEPVVSFDYVLDLAKECVRNNMPFGISTNGFMTKNSINALLDVGVTFVNMDIKSFDPIFLRNIIGLGKTAEHAKDIFIRNLKLFAEAECVKVLEISTPLIYKMNDTNAIDIAKEIARVDPYIPYHIQRMVPEHDFKGTQAPQGDIEALKEYYNKITNILEYVYFGAFPNTPFINTYCKKCKKLIVKRIDFGGCNAQAKFLALNGDKCKYCGEKNNIVA